MELQELSAFRGKVRIFGKLVSVAWEAGYPLKLHGLSSEEASVVLARLEADDAASVLEDGAASEQKKAALDAVTAGRGRDETPLEGKRTRRVAAQEAAPPDASGDGGEEPVCPECGCSPLGASDGKCAACTDYEVRGRATTKRIRDGRRSARAPLGSVENPRPAPRTDEPESVPSQAAAPEPPPVPTAAAEPEGGDPLAPPGALPLELLQARRVRQVVAYLVEHGMQKQEDIVRECERIKSQIPALALVRDMADRVGRVLPLMDLARS